MLADVGRPEGLQDRGAGVVHHHDHGGGAAVLGQGLDHGGGGPVALAHAAHLGGADQPQEAGTAEGIEGGAGIGAGAVDLGRRRRHDIVEDRGERGHVRGQRGSDIGHQRLPPEERRAEDRPLQEAGVSPSGARRSVRSPDRANARDALSDFA
jgi:hypothetical protein